MLPARKADSHKGSYGKAFIYSGGYGSAGCAVLAGKAAYRTGAGMVKIASPDCNRIIIQTALPEALYDPCGFTGRMKRINAWADVYMAGPGTGTGKEQIREIDTLINGSSGKPLVLDADAITIISSDAGRFLQEDIKRQAGLGRRIILTPHEGELHRLVKSLSNAPVDGDRLSLGMWVSEHLQCTVVAKGPDTYVITPGEDIYHNDDCGNPGMATAGSGDVLAGIITGLLAQGVPAHQAAVYGVRIHALAGDAAAAALGEHGLMAGDIAGFIR